MGLRSGIEKYFEFEENGAKLRSEILGGATTFATMVYVVVMNPLILSGAGLDFGAVMLATIIMSSVATMAMGLLARIPMAIAPGMGVSAFFTFALVLRHGFPWQMGLTACFFSGLVLWILNLLKIRQKIILSIPMPLLRGATGGIGLFLMAVALKELGLISFTEHAFIHFNAIFTEEILLTIVGICLIAIMMRKNIRSSFIIVMVLNFIVALMIGKTEWKGLIAFWKRR